jgi:hypothetical protein
VFPVRVPVDVDGVVQTHPGDLERFQFAWSKWGLLGDAISV